MVSLPLNAQVAQPAIRKPIFKIEEDSGGGAGLAGTVTGLLQNSNVDPWQRSVKSIGFESSLSGTVDHALIELKEDSESPDVSLGDELKISLGYDDGEPNLILSGVVSQIKKNIVVGSRLVLSNGSHRLSKSRINASYEEQSAGDIISALAADVEVETETVEAGYTYPYYVIDDRKSVYSHMLKIARDNGFELYFSSDGKLNLSSLSSAEVKQEFFYGIDIIALNLDEAEPLFKKQRVVGSGATSSEGADSWPWIVNNKDNISSEEGSDSAAPIRKTEALRSNEAVGTSAQHEVSRVSANAIRGDITVQGAPAVVVGHLIEIKETPEGKFDGQYRVKRVLHRYNKQEGFVSKIHFTSEGGSGGLGNLF